MRFDHSGREATASWMASATVTSSVESRTCEQTRTLFLRTEVANEKTSADATHKTLFLSTEVGSRVSGLGFRGSGFGFRASGFGRRVSGHEKVARDTVECTGQGLYRHSNQPRRGQ